MYSCQCAIAICWGFARWACSLDCMAIVTRRVQFVNLQIDITAINSKKCVNALIYNDFMTLYGYIKNDITDGSVQGRACAWGWNGLEWVASLYRDKMSI